jgi:transcription elongation factor GreA
MAEGTHLTPQALARLQEELAWRGGENRKEISYRIERAREHGDIKENADYDAAKNEQGLNEARIRQLEALVRHAVVLDASEAEVVAAGTVVELRMEGDDGPTTYLVGSIEERHDEFDVLSMSSPLGQALLGKGPGEVVTYEGPRKSFAVEVVSVRALL